MIRFALPLLGALLYAPAGLPDIPVREEIPCHGPGRTAVLVIDGQSNAGNHGLGLRQAGRGVVNFAPDNLCYRAIDPLLGADGTGANFATRLGDELIQSGKFDRVVLVPVAVGGASIAKLAEPDRLAGTFSKLAGAGLVPTHVLFQQGEADAGGRTNKAEYLASLSRLIRQYRDAGISAPFYVALASRCDLIRPANRDVIRDAQRAAWGLLAEAGPDMDANEGRNPIDGCHLSNSGVEHAARLWADFIR